MIFYTVLTAMKQEMRREINQPKAQQTRLICLKPMPHTSQVDAMAAIQLPLLTKSNSNLIKTIILLKF